MTEKILVVEDDRELRENIKTLLTEAGYSVLTAIDAESGLTSLEKNKIDLIISDIMLPGIDGYQFLQKLIKSKLAADIPFIFLTAKVDIADLRLGMEVGADDYIFKPFKAADLLSSVKTRLNRFNSIKHAIKIQSDQTGEKKEYKYDDRIYVELGVNPRFIQINEISYISAENQYSVIHINDKEKQLIRKSLNCWEKDLPSKEFLRIHRSTIVNLNYITKLERWVNNRIRLFLDGISEPLYVSKRYVNQFKRLNKPKK